MKSQEEIKKQLIQTLREQADRLEKGSVEDIVIYKVTRRDISVLEEVLELNIINNK